MKHDVAPTRLGASKRGRIFTPTNIALYLMLLPIVVHYILFSYLPMAGIALAFADFRVGGFRGWVGMQNFQYIFGLKFFWDSLKNTTVFIGLNYLVSFPAPILLALLLNEVRGKLFKKTVQTISVLPNFISWVVVSGMWMTLLSPTTGYINYVIKAFGGDPIFFLSKPEMFPGLLTFIRMWKGVGYSTIIYLAALSSVDPELYEAAVIDGASRWKQTLHITFPAIKPVILVVFVLSFSGVLNLFEPVYVFTNSNTMIKSTGEVLDTYIYTVGITNAKYSVAVAVGLFKSIIACILVLMTNYLSKWLSEDGKTVL